MPNTKFYWCHLTECDFSKKSLVYVKIVSDYVFLSDYYNASVVKEVNLVDGTFMGLILEVNPL